MATKFGGKQKLHQFQSQTEQLKGRSSVCINMFTLVNDLSAAQFVLSMSTGL